MILNVALPFSIFGAATEVSAAVLNEDITAQATTRNSRLRGIMDDLNIGKNY